ncbi:MAG TPA: ribonuclease III [Nitrospiria bacterium]|jgi:ribonuclease-3|nr:ribonuclease III [Nitrospiria bacterium]
MSSFELDQLQEKLSYRFKRPDLLRQAITHKSHLNENRDRVQQDNERLEFLGDAVLDLVVAELLINRFPGATEGELSKAKAQLVSEPMLSQIARQIEIGKFVLLGKGEELTQGREKASILSDTLEAIIAAFYLDGGFSTAKTFIARCFEEPIRDLAEPSSAESVRSPYSDYKTRLQELCQKEFETLPVYELFRESGPDHQKRFEIQLFIAGRVISQGVGRTKKEAEQMAAKEALKQLEKKRVSD